MGTSLRRERLRESWYFDCTCRRCKDPTEFGTYLDAIRCQICSGGHLLPQDPLDSQSQWSCSKCKALKSSGKSKAVVDRLLTAKDNLNRSDLRAYLDFLKAIDKELHENHYVLTATRRWIIPLYCRRLKAEAVVKVTDEMLADKVDMCRRYLAILDVIEAGFTKNRGEFLILRIFLILTRWDIDFNSSRFNNIFLKTDIIHKWVCN